MADSTPQPVDTLFQDYDRNLYALSADETTVDQAIDATSSNTNATVNNSAAVTADPSTVGSGSTNATTQMAQGELQSGNFVAGSTGWSIDASGNAEFNQGTFRGALVANSIDIPNTTSANSFHVDTTGNTWWGATTFATAIASVSKAGVGTFSNIVVTGGSITGTPIAGIPNNNSTDISLLGFTQNLTFTSASATQINWSSGTVALSNGRIFTISSGNTGTMAALTYIYVDPSVSSTVLQTTTTYSTAIGANKILIAAAQNNTVAASVITYGGGQPVLDGTANIAPASITTGSIAASSITAAQMSVSQLSAISANMGTITAGTINLSVSGEINSGQTAWDTGVGWWMEYNSGTPRFSIGNSTGNKMTWDGTTLRIRGTILGSSIYCLTGYGSTDNATFYTDDFAYFPGIQAPGSNFQIATNGMGYQQRNTTSDYASAANIQSVVKLGIYIYVLVAGTALRIYRYGKDTVSSGGTLMTFAGSSLPNFTTPGGLIVLTCDGTNFYMTYNGGNSSNAYILAKYSVSGTVFTYISSITCGSTTLGFNKNVAVLSSGNIYTFNSSLSALSKFNSSGTLQYTDATGSTAPRLEALSTIEDTLFAFDATDFIYSKLYYSN